MLVTNQTTVDYWFGPLHLQAGVGQTLTVDDTSATSLYLTNDSVADAINNLYDSGKITVSAAADPFPRPTGTPTLLHGDGSPEGLVFAPQGSIYMRRDGSLTNGGTIYVKLTGLTINTGWYDLSHALGIATVSPTGTVAAYVAATAPAGWLLCDGSPVSRTTYSTLFGVVGTAYGAGDGSTTFNLPDLRGRVGVGFAASGGHIDVSTIGNNDGSTAPNRRPKHRHTPHTHSSPSFSYRDQATTFGSNTIAMDSTVLGSHTVPGWSLPTADGGSGNSNDSLDAPAWLVVNYIIKT